MSYAPPGIVSGNHRSCRMLHPPPLPGLQPGPDHPFAMEYDEFKEYVSNINTSYELLVNPKFIGPKGKELYDFVDKQYSKNNKGTWVGIAINYDQDDDEEDVDDI